MTIRVGLVGYGAGGRYFHAPFIQASPFCELVGVVTASPLRAAQVQSECWPAVVFGSLLELINHGVDVVVISTPPETRRGLVLEAISRGVHVVADKPFAPTAEAALELTAAADSAGVLLGVFHNRRWDTDLVTLKGIVAAGKIGSIARFDSRFDLDHPASLEGGPRAGCFVIWVATSLTKHFIFSGPRSMSLQSSTGATSTVGVPIPDSFSLSDT
jgi:predicted dehydrogenase